MIWSIMLGWRIRCRKCHGRVWLTIDTANLRRHCCDECDGTEVEVSAAPIGSGEW